MVVKSDGTKWACMSCLKGHRVSGCTHTDRDLVLVPKKGRPVTQCQHCRQERKKRSAHVRCDCGEIEKPHHPREKCIHLREAEERAKVGLHGNACDEKDADYLVAVAEEQGCCCHHGGKCSCSLLKKEFKDADGMPHGPAVKPRLESTRSESSITVFQNGHHKPVHRKNHAAHECGMPYKIPLPRSNTDHCVAGLPRRSVDSLATSSNTAGNATAFSQLMGDVSATCSGQHSPSASSQGQPSSQSLTDPAYDRIGTIRPVVRSQSASSSDLLTFPSFDNSIAINDGTYEHWSMSMADMSVMPNNNPFGVWPTSNDLTNMVQPALTAASSGTQSEIDEIPAIDDVHGFGMPSIQEDAVNFNSANNAASPQSNRRSLPPNFFSPTDFTFPIEGEWSASLISDPTVETKSPKTYVESPSMAFTDPWQMNSAAQRSANAYGVGGGRPAAHSVGPDSAPTDDLMQQLFPEININDDNLASGSPMHISQASGKTFGEVSNNDSTDFVNFDLDTTFPASNWTEGAAQVSNDVFNSPFDMDADSSNPDFSNVWSR